MVLIIRLFIALTALVFVFHAFKKNTKGALYVSLVILTAILLSNALNSFAGIISDVGFLNFLRQIALGISGLIVYIELALIVFISFFSKYSFKKDILKIASVVYVVLVLLIEFNVF